MIAVEEERRYEFDRRELEASFASVSKEGVAQIIANTSSSDPNRARAFDILHEAIKPAYWKAKPNHAQTIPGMSARAAQGIVEAANASVFSDAAWAEVVRLWKWKRIVKTAEGRTEVGIHTS